MDEYPDENEEFELMYGDELELIKETGVSSKSVPKSRKSLDFQSPSGARKISTDCNDIVNSTIGCTSIHNTPEENNTNKRTVDELFGDIDDITLEELNLPIPKRVRLDEEEKNARDLELIEQIVEARRRRAVQRNGNGFDRNCAKEKVKYDPQYNLSYTVPNYSFLPLTNAEDRQMYIRFHSEQYMDQENERYIKKLTGNDFAIGSFNDVMAEAMNHLKKLEESGQVRNEAIQDEQMQNTTNLWVDIYKPRRYIELLSDEGTNKTLLKWLKLWDKVVFNRKPKIKPIKQEDTTVKFNKYKRNELSTKLDEHGKPEHKIVLLCGPPGLGKTTLAHIVAKHAGYNVVEVNASDERSVDTFKRILENATQMTSVIDKEKRPNCIIFDEIDGAPTPSIDFLIKFVNGEHVTKNKKNKNKKPFILKRPIICICNDVYVPALRALRKIAFVIHFPLTSTLRLSERLCEIARKQRIKTDMGTMIALSEKTENDIRTCLSILHFFKSQNTSLTLSDVHDTSIGEKDMFKGLFAVWNDIFTISGTSRKDRMANILKTVRSFGDYERLMNGVFENYLSVMENTSKIEDVADGLDWFCYFDVTNRELLSQQNYDLASYLPYAFVAWNYAFATRVTPKLKYPNVMYESRMTTIKNNGIVNEILNGVEPSSLGIYVDTLTLILDILPLLSRLIVPSFRALNEHLHSYKEKEDLQRIVNIMVDYNITYLQERTPEGSYVYQIEPDIDRIAFFPTLRTQSTISYNTKQIIGREVDIVKMKRLEAIRNRNVKEPKTKEENVKKLTSKAPAPEPIYKDFFGRITARPKNQLTVTENNYDIWYKYKEGYTNAVRRKIKISSLK